MPTHAYRIAECELCVRAKNAMSITRIMPLGRATVLGTRRQYAWHEMLATLTSPVNDRGRVVRADPGIVDNSAFSVAPMPTRATTNGGFNRAFRRDRWRSIRVGLGLAPYMSDGRLVQLAGFEFMEVGYLVDLSIKAYE